MATSTTNIGLTKPAGSDGINVAVFNSNFDTIDATTGALSALSTSNKGSLVLAINELVTRMNALVAAMGTLSSLTTTEKTSLVGAINEIGTRISA